MVIYLISISNHSRDWLYHDGGGAMNFYIFHANDCGPSIAKEWMWAVQFREDYYDDGRHYKMVKEVL